MIRIYTKKSEQEKRRKLRKEMTKAEVLLWLELKNKKLGARFLRQYSIGSYVVDFYSPKVRLAVEADGATHFTDAEIEYDKNRQNEIEELGIKFLRFTNFEIYENLNHIISKIKSKIEELSTS